MDLFKNLRIHNFDVNFVQWVPPGTTSTFPDTVTLVHSRMHSMRHGGELGLVLGENWRALRNTPGDIVHASSPSLAPLARHFGSRFVITLHDVCYLSHFGNSKAMSLYYIQKYFSLDNTMNVICCSNYTMKRAMSYLDLDPKKTRVVYNSVDTSVFRPIERGELPANFGKDGDFLMLHVGYDAPTKNLQVLLRALAKLPDRFKLVRVGTSAPRTLRLAKRLGVSSRLIQLSSLSPEDLRRVYWGAHVLVHPSVCEGFGRPVVEALACGTPVITSNLSCLPEIVGNAGQLVDVSEEAELVSAVASMADRVVDPNLRERGVVRARNFSLESQFAQLRTAYDTFKL
jgi:glycosyltransferase involved in cell wall biosynthesis